MTPREPPIIGNGKINHIGGSDGIIHWHSADFGADLLLDDLGRHQELSKENLMIKRHSPGALTSLHVIR
jgi:hypothetical protein